MAAPAVPLVERRTIALKIETVYGTDVFAGTVTLADVMEAYEIMPESGPQNVDIPTMGGLLTNLGSVPGTRIGQVSFAMMLRGGGSAYSTTVKPAVDVALRACGMLGTFSATPTPNWVYTPKSTGFEAVTCYVMNEYGPTVKLTGAFGSGQIMFSMGRPVIMRVTLQGIYTTETDTPTIVTKAVSTSPAWPTFLNAAAVWGAYSPVLANASLNFGNSLDVIESANNAAGIAGVIFGTRRPSGSIDPAVTVRGASGFDFIADWEAATPRLVAWGTNGVQYQRCKVEAPRAVIRSRPWIARGTKAAWQLGFDCTPNLGDDDYKITFD